MFSESKVLQKCFYDEVAPIWMDRARQALQDDIVCFYMTCEVFPEMYGMIQQFSINVTP
jgi:hypothetical protein